MPGAFSDWSVADFGMLATAGAAINADTQSTKDSIKRGGYETNPIFGTPHPSGAALDQAGLAGGALTVAVANWLSPRHRKEFLAGVTGLESTLAINNTRGTTKGNFGEAIAMPVLIGAASALFVNSLMPDLHAYMKPATSGKPEVGISYERTF